MNENLTIAVLCSGPSMSATVAEALRDSADKVIVVNHTHRLAPWADILVSIDSEALAEELRGFEGEKVFPSHGEYWERVGSHEFRNSGLAAIRVAVERGASRVLVAGFEPETVGRWFPDDEPDVGQPHPYEHVRDAFVQMQQQLATMGVALEVWQPEATEGAKPKAKRVRAGANGD